MSVYKGRKSLKPTYASFLVMRKIQLIYLKIEEKVLLQVNGRHKYLPVII